jgi:hypothetical protein
LELAVPICVSCLTVFGSDSSIGQAAKAIFVKKNSLSQPNEIGAKDSKRTLRDCSRIKKTVFFCSFVSHELLFYFAVDQ